MTGFQPLAVSNRFLWTINIFVLLSALAPISVYAEARYALVIGNSNYLTQPLKNPVNDAEDVAEKFSSQGFKVKLMLNADKRSMTKAIREFTLLLSGSDKVGVFYYAGHGVEVRGENYLIPVNADIHLEEDVEFEAMNAGRVLAGMENAGNGLNMVILDACRDNPYTRSFRSARRGLNRMNAPKGSIILYAAQPGKVAQDGSGRNGVFTKHFLATIDKPGLTVERVFKETARGVNEETGGQQVPWVEGVVLGDFYFSGTVKPEIKLPATPSPAPASSQAIELAYWQSIQSSSNPELLELYLKQYPRGVFSDIARLKLQGLQNLAEIIPPQVTGSKGIEALLRDCKLHFHANRLTTGPGGNAAACYAEVLRQSPGNREALQGLSAVEKKYQAWAEAALKQSYFDKVRGYLQKLKMLNADSQVVMAIENRLDAAVKELAAVHSNKDVGMKQDVGSKEKIQKQSRVSDTEHSRVEIVPKAQPANDTYIRCKLPGSIKPVWHQYRHCIRLQGQVVADVQNNISAKPVTQDNPYIECMLPGSQSPVWHKMKTCMIMGGHTASVANNGAHFKKSFQENPYVKCRLPNTWKPVWHKFKTCLNLGGKIKE